ncbi:MAG: hypothetical protein QW096_11790 [Thermofilaceae archaeon]
MPLAYFAVAVDIMKWPPPGDIIAHGLQVSLLRYNGKILLTLEPLSPDINHYPRGFHVFVANLSELTGLYSGETVFITGAFLSALMPSLLFSITYMLTDSFALSLIPYITSFHVHSTRHLEKWIFGYFFNGPYPCFSAMIFFMLLISLLVIFQKENSKIILYSIILVLSQLFLTYPNFFLTASLSLLFIGKHLLKIIKSKLLILILIISSLATLPTIFTVGLSHIGKLTSDFNQSYKISLSYFSDRTTVSIFIAIPLAIYMLVKKESVIVSTIYLLTLLVNLISISNNEFICNLLSVVLPSRQIILNWMLAWIIISNFLANFLKHIENILNIRNIYFNLKLCNKCIIKFGLNKSISYIVKLIFLLLILQIFYIYLFWHFSLSLVNNYSWYTRLHSFTYDYNISIWVSQNIPSDELILNDMSFSGLYIPSYTYKNIVFHYFRPPPEYIKARLIWFYPENASLVMGIIKELKIKWIVVTAERSYLDLWTYGGSSGYKEKPLEPRQYISIFDNYPFLEKMYEYGDSAVYKVSASLRE